MSVTGAVAVQPLADQRGPVAGVVEPRRQDVPAVVHAVPAVGVKVALDPMVVRVLAGDEGCAGRAAEREGVNRVVERGALLCQQPPHVRHQLDVGGGHVVGHHHKDVRAVIAVSADGPGLRARAQRNGSRERQRRGHEACPWSHRSDRLAHLRSSLMDPLR